MPKQGNRMFMEMSENQTYIVAELSANHHQSIESARELIRAAKSAGADAVKLQTYTADTLTIQSTQPDFVVPDGSLWTGRTLYDLYDEAHTPWDWHPELFALAHQLGLDCFSTPFDNSSVDFLEELNPPCYKISSFELIDLPLIDYVASKGRPIIMSTGMGTLEEITEAVNVVRRRDVPLILLKCTSAYPSPAAEMDLSTIPELARRFDVTVGLSDHTLGIAVPVAAVALGARVVEKHFTISRDQPGPDSAFSLEPTEFGTMVEAVRNAEQAIGSIRFEPTAREESSRVFRRSLYVVADMAAGDRFTAKNVRSIRPGYGMAPKHLPDVIGKSASRSLSRGTALEFDMIN